MKPIAVRTIGPEQVTLGELALRKTAGAAQRTRGALLRKLVGVRAGPDLRVGRHVLLRGVRGIHLGSYVTLTDDVWLNVISGLGLPFPQLEIGNNVGLGRRTTISVAEHVTIGHETITAPNVLITDHNHAHRSSNRAIRSQGITDPDPVLIGAGCWLGANCIILPGARIGDGSVVGANAVVRGSHPPKSVLVGCPARNVG